MPGHNRVVDRIAAGRELFYGRGWLAAVLLASLASAVPVSSLHAPHFWQWAQGLESGGADKLHFGAGRMEWFAAFHLLSVVGAQGLRGVAIEFSGSAAVFYGKARSTCEKLLPGNGQNTVTHSRISGLWKYSTCSWRSSCSPLPPAHIPACRRIALFPGDGSSEDAAAVTRQDGPFVAKWQGASEQLQRSLSHHGCGHLFGGVA